MWRILELFEQTIIRAHGAHVKIQIRGNFGGGRGQVSPCAEGRDTPTPLQHTCWWVRVASIHGRLRKEISIQLHPGALVCLKTNAPLRHPATSPPWTSTSLHSSNQIKSEVMELCAIAYAKTGSLMAQTTRGQNGPRGTAGTI